AGRAAPVRATGAFRRGRRSLCGRRRAGDERAVTAHPARPARSRIPALPRARPWRRHLRGDPPEGPHRPPPLRIVRRRRAVPAAGGARSGRGRHQADALPHLEQFPDRARAGGSGGSRQVGHRADRAQGALRRRGQYPLGPRPRARRRAGGLRLHRIEDPRETVDGGAPRGRQSHHL
ncbi:hypothetical protein KXV85_003940, partial [Aspergillus fumigatus]